MRILIHSNAPWVPTGYGLQGKLLADQLSQDGHTVAFSAFAGLGGADVWWRETRDGRTAGRKYQVMPSGQMAFGIDMLMSHAQRFKAELIITCMDFYKLHHLGAALTSQCPVLAWTPVDCAPLSRQDEAAFRATGAIPVAMSNFGADQLDIALVPEVAKVVHYAPHAIDTLNDYYPMEDRIQFREELGVNDKFVIGLCAANKDAMRKAFPEQFRAFGIFLRSHPESVLLVHSLLRSVSGLDLGQLATDMGIADHVMFSDTYVQDSGLFTTDMMRRWYNSLDVLMLCSYGEGFGIPLIEAQACGTPVITTDASAMSELVGSGYQVRSTQFWNPIHQAFWSRPDVDDIVKKLKLVHNWSDIEERRAKARIFGRHYDVGLIYAERWRPIIDSVTVDRDAVDADTTVS